ncbi:MAG: flagellar protein FliT [Bacillota bacterium]
MTRLETLRETTAQYRELLAISRETPAAAAAEDLDGLLGLLERRDRVFARIRELGPELAGASWPPKANAELAGLIRETMAADRLSQAAISRRLGLVREGLGEVQRGRATGRAYRKANAASPPTARFIDEVR